MTSYVLRGDFLEKLREDPQKAFWYDLNKSDPCSVAACEANHVALMILTATFADSQVPPHSTWTRVWKDIAGVYGIFGPKTRKKVVKVPSLISF